MAITGAVAVARECYGIRLLPTAGTVAFEGFLALMMLYVVVFSVTALVTLNEARDIDKRGLSREEEEKVVQEAVMPALEGRVEPPTKLLRLLQVSARVWVGMVAGALLAWIFELSIDCGRFNR